MPLIRRIGNLFFARLLTIVGRAAVTDSASGMRVFRKSTLELLSPLPDGLNLTPVMSTRAVHERIRVVERPIPYSERQGESKLSVAGDGLRFLSTIVWTALTYNPVRILGLIGLAGIGVAVAVALGLVVARLERRRRPSARPASSACSRRWSSASPGSASSRSAPPSTTWCRCSITGRSARACSRSRCSRRRSSGISCRPASRRW